LGLTTYKKQKMIQLGTKIKEVCYKSKDYYDGLSYLLEKHPENFHLRSCYEGFSFKNLAQCITFDRHQTTSDLSEYLNRPRRFVAYSGTGDITGIMVTASFPEFYRYIDYENYFIIGAETVSDYSQFLKYVSTKNRAEIITFKNTQIKLIKSRFRVKNIHAWSIYSFGDKRVSNSRLAIRLMDRSDVKTIEHLPIKQSEELSPFRSLQFQLKGLRYKNYIVSYKDIDQFYIGIRPYCTGVYQIDYAITTTNNKLLPNAIAAVGKIVKDSGSKLIWRLRYNEFVKKKTLISKSGLIKSMEEKHLHLRQNKEV
jgi:hypothetical protein